MTQDNDERSVLFKRLDRTEQIAATIGLVLSGVPFAAGMAGLVYVVINVLRASPPKLGSQGEWLYGGVACLLVAGWGFGQGSKFFARLRKTKAPVDHDLRAPKIQIGSEGLSIELPPLPTQNAAAKRSPAGFTWSFSSDPMPIKTFKLDEAQLAAADAAAGSRADWDAACRQVNPDYATWSDFEQDLYRHAVQSVIEDRRGKMRG
jgi:hypothetical protein